MSRFRILLLVLILAAGATTVDAQYFGRNKVQYEDFDFKVIKTDHLRVYYYPALERAANDGARMAERWYMRFRDYFEHTLKDGQPLILYANHGDFQQTNVISGIIHQGTGGVTEGMKNRVVLPMAGVYSENNHVIGHELVHAFQYSIVKKYAQGVQSLGRLPLWFVEGMAEYLSIGPDYTLTDMWAREAVLNDQIPTIRDLANSQRYFPYRWGHAFWMFISAEYGDGAIPKLLKAGVNTSWKNTVRQVLRTTPDSLDSLWQEWVSTTYHPQLTDRTHPDSLGRSVLKEGEAELFLSPSVSPDGDRVVFFSQRGLFSLGLFMADIESGEVTRQLVSASTNSHFDAIKFIEGAGGWSPDSKQFAFVVFKDGDNTIAIVDTESGDITRTLATPDIEGIFHVQWSPDGSQLVFSGSVGGISDLFLYDLATDEITPLTDDRHADIHPVWSPDGNTIAFATDRAAGTSFETLDFAPMVLGLYDLSSGAITLLQMAPGAKHVSPQFSPDGNSLYFISNADNYSDIYRYDFQSETYHRLTRVATGVSGLTELSPALSVAANSGRMVATVFDKANYRLRHFTASDLGEEPVNPRALADAKIPKHETTVSSYLREPEQGLPTTGGFEYEDYSVDLDLLAISQPYAGVATDNFGTTFAGGISLLFGDMLGNHLVGVTGQISGGLKDLGGQAYYLNRDRRLNYGVVAGHIPYKSIFLRESLDTVTVNGQPTEVLNRQLVEERAFIDQASLFADYPLNTNQRFELSGGFQHIWYDTEIDRILIAPNGQIVDESTIDGDNRPSLNLGRGSAAFVGDYSFMGFTSPLRGARYRLEVSPTIGDLTYITALADYRKYFFIRPVTLALRGMHIGRYLDDADSDRLSELFLGYETLVRGYGISGLSASDCPPGTPLDECPEINRLVGSRLGIVNAEVRLPLAGPGDFGLISFGYLPTEFVGFFDGGVAWTKNSEPELKWATNSNERVPVFSSGAALRVNIGGYIIAQFYWAYPFQRPESNGEFGFVIAPGW